ncbi:MAG: transporter substrate-binding domain-containing protein [Acholeplasmataceae bacterium]|nr:transporter substrate-binding domain-containing protein [Acholeplasmataceae bacterium]
MKKILFIFTVIFTVIMLSSCQSEDNILRVGMDLRYPPFESVTVSNDPEGISVDIANAFGAYIGREVKIINTEFSSIIPDLQSGGIDIAIASMSITEAREIEADFSETYFYFKIISLINKSFADANNLTEDSTIEDILAIESTRYIGIAAQVSVQIPSSYGKDVTEAIDVGTAVESVAQGTSDILLMSANPVVNGYNANPNTTMIVWDSFVSSPIGMATKNGNTELINQANAFIATFNDEGGLYSVLSEKWDSIILGNLGRFGLSFYINE